MRAWSIGEVARFLGVKPYIIRYWESELPLLSPRKGRSGRREYSSSEIRLLMRFRHLLYEKKFTIEGAKRRMWEELGAGKPDLRARFAEMRSDLIDALMTVRRARRSGNEGSDPAALEMPDVCDPSPGAPGASGETHDSLGDDMTEKAIRARFEALGQEHLFAFWEARPAPMKRRLMDDLSSLDLETLQRLRDRLLEEPAVLSGGDAGRARETLEPAPYVPLSRSAADREARKRGEELIRLGKTAVLTVAGGQGTRLGIEGPKGMFPISPIRRLSLFALHAEKLLAARRWYGARIPWLIMTSPLNREATQEYFRSEDWFGLDGSTVRFFSQGALPSLSPDGGLVMGLDGGLLLNPNGHGGVIDALAGSGALAELRDSGVEELFYFQVDNPLVRVPDPLFLGFHRGVGSEISSKVVEKAYPEEKLGVIVKREGRLAVIEYSDLDEALMKARGSDGRLLFSQASIAIHILNVEFLGRTGLTLPFHLARKKVKALKPTSGGADILEEDVVKMEMFIFDAIPLAGTPVFFETDRAEEFAPLKNKEGLDSIETCVRGQIEKAARWLSSCGVEVPRDAEGRSIHAVEISSLFAADPEILAAKRGSLKDRIDEDTLLV